MRKWEREGGRERSFYEDLIAVCLSVCMAASFLAFLRQLQFLRILKYCLGTSMQSVGKFGGSFHSS
jgi:hypothetical protein